MATEPSGRLKSALADRYVIEREVGHGGMATVYLARDRRHDRRVAVKVLRPEFASAIGTGRFLREITLTARLDHPGIVPLLDSGEADGFLYYVMPFVDGESLRDRLRREKQLPVGDAVQIARELADTLQYAHSTGILHRDIKPENILLATNHARLADFGIARAVLVASGDELTETGLAVGTIPYMSPEQAVGTKELDGRSDIYSLGCVLYEMLAGELPFSAPTPQALLARKSIETPRPVHFLRPAVPPHVEHAILQALAPVPADRQGSVSEFAAQLGRADGIPAAPTILTRRARHSATALASVLASVAVVMGGLQVARACDRTPAPEIVATRIAIFPFIVEDPDLAYLREGLMDLVGTAIDGAGLIRRVDPYALMNRLAQEGSTNDVDLRTARRIARDLGAGRFLLGRVVPSGRTIQVVTAIYREADPSEPQHRFEYEGTLDGTSELISAMGRDILLHIPTGAGTWPSEASVAAQTTVDAIREYSRGEQLLRQSRHDTAAMAFRRALSSDSTFALAWLRLAFAEELRLNDREMVQAIDRALQFADRLSPRDRLLAQAVHGNYHGDGAAAERAALSLASTFPQYGEAWYQVASSRFWYAWQSGRSPVEAEAALAEALRIDPDDRQSLNLLSWLAAYRGDHAEAERLQRKAWGHRWFLPANPGEFSDFIADAKSWHTARLFFLSYWTAAETDRLDDAGEISQFLTDVERRPPETQALGHVISARVHTAGGRWQAAENALGMADRAVNGMGTIEVGWHAALPFLGVPEQTRTKWRDSLARWSPPQSYLDLPRSRQLGRTPYFGTFLGTAWLAPHLKNYVVGLLSAGLGDTAAAAKYARLLESSSEPMDSVGLLHDLSTEIHALSAMQQGDTATALVTLEALGLRVASRHQVYESLLHTRPLGRLLRAEALRAMGRDREALGWYAPLASLDPGFVLQAWACLRQGQIYEGLNEPQNAAHHYQRFVTRWSKADRQHQELVKLLRHRAAALTAAATAVN